jgi:hypothetical protein
MKIKMEYKLQQRLQRDWRRLLMPSSPYPILSSYPAIDYIVPGIGHAATYQSFFVPINGVVDVHNIEKKKELEKKLEQNDQEGGGESSEKMETNTFVSEENPEDFNDRKRKLLGNAVFESFSNPKPITTKTILLQNQDTIKRFKKDKDQDIVKDKARPKIKAEKKEDDNFHKFKFF